MDVDVDLSGGLTERLTGALLEATVFGVAYDAEAAVCRLHLDVLALPEVGPVDPDPRRVLVLSGVGSVEVVLREDRHGDEDRLGPALPLSDLAELAAFFASLGSREAMYGTDFFDGHDPRPDWPVERSLHQVNASALGGHTLYWFTECSAIDASGRRGSYFLEGFIEFAAADVERPDGAALTLAEFAADGDRWWRAFLAGDPRVSGARQQGAEVVPRSWQEGLDQTTTGPGQTQTDLDPVHAAFAEVFRLPAWWVARGRPSPLAPDEQERLYLEFGQPVLQIKELRREPVLIDGAPAETLVRPTHLRGTWHLTLVGPHWSVWLGDVQLATDRSPAGTIDRALDILDGQALTGVQVSPQDGGTTFTFDLGCRLRTETASATAGTADPREVWKLTHAFRSRLIVRNDGMFAALPIRGPADEHDWQPIP